MSRTVGSRPSRLGDDDGAQSDLMPLPGLARAMMRQPPSGGLPFGRNTEPVTLGWLSLMPDVET